MTDVPLRDHQDAVAKQRDRTLLIGALGIVLTIFAVMWGNERTNAATIAGMEKATSVAFDAANEKGVHHNGLIDRMREMSKQYVTWPVVILLIGLGVSLSDRVWGDSSPVTVENPASDPVPVDPAPKVVP